MDYNLIWYFILGFLLIGYAILDGFDLGVGILHLTTKTDQERRILMNSIGPVWDGNEVWLVTAGGALFAAFPEVYATVFSGFYLPFMMLLVFLIFRAVSLEFRSKEAHASWRKTWDFFFFLGSLFVSFLFGLLIGNAVIGIPLDQHFEFTGTFLQLLNPYAIFVGLFVVSMFALHGLIYLGFKTDGLLYTRLRKLFWPIFFLFASLFTVVSIYTLVEHTDLIANFSFGLIPVDGPWANTLHQYRWLISTGGWGIVLLNILALINIPRTFLNENYRSAFLSSSLLIAGLIGIFALGLFPNLVYNAASEGVNMNIYNAASSTTTLRTMLIVATIGFPFVLSYTIVIYRIFRGKTTLDSMSY